MTGAGNDLVALAAIDVARTRQPQFYSRIITPAEKELYSFHFGDLLPFEHFVWLVWSVKESAYKFLKRFDPGLIFSPSKMEIIGLRRNGEYFEGAVRSKEHVLYSKTIIDSDLIFSMVNDADDFSAFYWDIKQISSSERCDQSEAVKELLLSKLTQILPGSNLSIAKNPNGWPVVMDGDEELPVPVSFTHHQHFVAYTFQLNSTLWKAHAEIL